MAWGWQVINQLGLTQDVSGRWVMTVPDAAPGGPMAQARPANGTLSGSLQEIAVEPPIVPEVIAEPLTWPAVGLFDSSVVSHAGIRRQSDSRQRHAERHKPCENDDVF